MAEPEGTAGLDDTLDGSETLEDEDLDALDAEGEIDAEDGEEDAEPPRRRLVSELLEGQEDLAASARADLQLVAPPLHVEVGDSGQPIYQLDLSSDEPEGTLLEPDPPSVDAEQTGQAAAAAPAGDDAVPLGGDAHAVIKQMISHRDRQVMAAERDGIGAYELAAGIDHFVATLIDTVRRSGD